jgi:hypothetical protein
MYGIGHRIKIRKGNILLHQLLALAALSPNGALDRSLGVALGRVIAQAVNRWLPNAEGRVRAQVRPCGTCGGQSGIGAGFLRVLLFPMPILIPPTAPYSSSSIICVCYNRPKMADIQNRPSLTTPQETKKKNYM